MVRLPTAAACELHIPTGPLDAWSFRERMGTFPATPGTHSVLNRGDEFLDPTHCTSNANHVIVGGRSLDTHEARGGGVGSTTSGEVRHHIRTLGATWADCPPAEIGNIQVLDFQMEWVYRDITADTSGFPAGLDRTLAFGWGLAWNWIDDTNAQTGFDRYVLWWDTTLSTTHIYLAVFRTANAGNIYRAGVMVGTPYALMVKASNVTDLRLQVVLGRDVTNPTHAECYVSVDGGEIWTLTHEYDRLPLVNLPDPGEQHRLYDLYLGGGFDHNQMTNANTFRVTRYWDCYSYLWNPRAGWVFAYAGRSGSARAAAALRRRRRWNDSPRPNWMSWRRSCSRSSTRWPARQTRAGGTWAKRTGRSCGRWSSGSASWWPAGWRTRARRLSSHPMAGGGQA